MTANRSVPDSTNTSLPTDAPAWQRDVNDETKALWLRAPERLASVAGTNTITATMLASDVPALAAYGKILVLLRPANNNTGAVTLNIDGLGAKNVLDIDGNALVAGELVAGRTHQLEYDGTAWRVLSNGSAPPASVVNNAVVAVKRVANASGTLSPTGSGNYSYSDTTAPTGHLQNKDANTITHTALATGVILKFTWRARITFSGTSDFITIGLQRDSEANRVDWQRIYLTNVDSMQNLNFTVPALDTSAHTYTICIYTNTSNTIAATAINRTLFMLEEWATNGT